MLPNAFITHATQGRVRIKIPDRKGDSTYFSSLKEKLVGLSELPGIQRVEANPMTGSILVLHALDLQATDLEMVAQYGEFNNLFCLRLSPPQQASAPGRPVQALQETNRKVGVLTGGEIDAEILAILGLLGIAVVQLKRGNIMIPAVSALWYVYSLLKDRQRKHNNGSHTETTAVKEMNDGQRSG